MTGSRVVAFVPRALNRRGTSVAVFDYAEANETVLGNRSLIVLDDSVSSEPEALERFQRRFAILSVRGPERLDAELERARVDLAYFIKAGVDDGWTTRSIPAAVHAVFPTWASDAHGTYFAYVSRWLSRVCTGSQAPFVPHIVSMADSDVDRRRELAIPNDALVVGCYGGRDAFDIAFAREALAAALGKRRDLWFVAMNLDPFVAHERALFLPGASEPLAKRRFINTCDIMLHARKRGETFGLAIAEFSSCNKPVMTWGKSPERAHLDMLGDSAMVYRDRRDLSRLLLGLDRPSLRNGDWDRFSHDYAREPVMREFSRVFFGEPTDLASLRRARVGPEDWGPASLARYFRRIRRRIRGKGP